MPLTADPTPSEIERSDPAPDDVAPAGRRIPELARRAFADFSAHPAAVLLVFLVAMCVGLSVADDAFLTRNNLVAVGLAVSVVGIAAVGQTIVVISGGLDLSTESVIALTSVVIADQLQAGVPVGATLLLGIGVGAAAGLVNGLVIAKLRVNPVIATLGSLTFLRGFARIYAEGRTIPVSDQTMRDIGLGELPGGVPVPVVVMLGCFALGAVVMIWTTFGRNAYLVGDNLEAARLAGLRISRLQVVVYVIAGMFSAVAGIIFTATVGAGLPNGANGTSLTVIAAVILGGTSLLGGIGRVGGTVVGVLVLGVIDNGLVLLDVNSDYQLVVVGLILVIAVALDQGRLRLKELAFIGRTRG
ncbi:MAG: ABC transporter permease [Acidimicrobiales bacterium]